MSACTYAVSWHTSAGTPCAGCLGLGPRGFTLTGASKGRPVRQEVAFEDIDGVWLSGGRLEVQRRDGGRLLIGSLDAPGALREVAERLARRPTASASS